MSSVLMPDICRKSCNSDPLSPISRNVQMTLRKLFLVSKEREAFSKFHRYRIISLALATSTAFQTTWKTPSTHVVLHFHVWESQKVSLSKIRTARAGNRIREFWHLSTGVFYTYFSAMGSILMPDSCRKSCNSDPLSPILRKTRKWGETWNGDSGWVSQN